MTLRPRHRHHWQKLKLHSTEKELLCFVIRHPAPDFANCRLGHISRPVRAHARARHGVLVDGQETTGLRDRRRKILMDREREGAAAREAIERLVSRGPPEGSGISFDAWRSWHRYRWVICPASRGRRTCSNKRCRMGADCRELWALGLRGNRSPLPRKERPVCGARRVGVFGPIRAAHARHGVLLGC
jgi:hypothetical protein